MMDDILIKIFDWVLPESTLIKICDWMMPWLTSHGIGLIDLIIFSVVIWTIISIDWLYKIIKEI